MAASPERLSYLFTRFTERACTREELREWLQAVTDQAKAEGEVLEPLLDHYYRQMEPGADDSGIDWETMFRQVIRQQKARVIPLSRRSWLRHWRWAAVIILLLGVSSYFLFYDKSQKPIALTQAQRFRNDVPPGTIRAVLTLADGTKITLDSAKSGQLAVQGKTTVTNNNGALTYAGKTTPDLLYNTLSTKRGEQSPPLTLSDGTKVWLNAASSIRFPVAFIGHTRNVEITGEAYFEVMKKTTMPFVVKRIGSDESIQVLGTHFNVNAYDGEEAMKTTLLEGAVKVIKGRKSSILRPGQQAVLDNKSGQIKVIDDADIAEVMAWKNGVFKFNDATIRSIMQQMARWYDVEVVYDTKISQHFVADIPRTVPVSELLRLLELTDQVHFKIEGKKITVIP